MTPSAAGFAVTVSANIEWEVVRSVYPDASMDRSPFGEFFWTTIQQQPILFFHGGWGKVAAASSTQYLIDRFTPRQLLNLGTCGGIEGRVRRFDIVAVERAVIYAIHEAMGDAQEAVSHYTTDLVVPPGLPTSIIRTTIYSADRDLTPGFLWNWRSDTSPASWIGSLGQLPGSQNGTVCRC